MLVDALREHAAGLDTGLMVADIRIGLGYTAAVLSDGRCGLAYTLHEQPYETCSVVAEAGRLAGRPAAELISWIRMKDATACAVGLATINALLDWPAAAAAADISELLAVGRDDTVGMIGYFGPLVRPLKERARALHIFERNPDRAHGILPESSARDLLPGCQVVVMTATALLNHTIDGLLDLCADAREIALLGPSTPFAPEVFRGRGVTMLSGLQVVDAGRILRIVSEGGGTRKFGSAVRKLSFRLDG